MNTSLPLCLTVICYLLRLGNARADEQFATIVARHGVGAVSTTNTFEVPSGRTAQVVTLSGYNATIYAIKDLATTALATSFPSTKPTGFSPDTVPAATMTPPTIVGPATLQLATYGGSDALATIRLLPQFADPQKTAIVLPGLENTAQVTMQCSTNLVDWVAATNGVYGGNVAKFFRINLEKAAP